MANSKTKSRGLGRGLDALFGDEHPIAFDMPKEDVREVPLSAIHPGRFQPRRDFKPEQIQELANSIREQGLLSPILVRVDTIEGGYEIIAGERRFRALSLLGEAKATVIIKNFDDKQTLAVALIENLQREDLNPLEEAQGISRLVQEFSFTHEQAAKVLGRSRAATTNALRLLELTEPVQLMLSQGELMMGHARALLALQGAQQFLVAKEVVLKGLSVRQTEALVRHTLEKITRKPVARKNPDEVKLEETLADLLGAVVKVSANKKGKGRLVIEFSNLEQLQGIVEYIQR